VEQKVPRNVIPLEEQDRFESEKLWKVVTWALIEGDQRAATEEKTRLEKEQREGTLQHTTANTPWAPKYFETDGTISSWTYKWINLSRFDPKKESLEYESGGRVYSAPPLRLLKPPPEVDEDSNPSSDDDEDEEDMTSFTTVPEASMDLPTTSAFTPQKPSSNAAELVPPAAQLSPKSGENSPPVESDTLRQIRDAMLTQQATIESLTQAVECQKRELLLLQQHHTDISSTLRALATCNTTVESTAGAASNPKIDLTMVICIVLITVCLFLTVAKQF
jgi:hypothetical protein